MGASEAVAGSGPPPGDFSVPPRPRSVGTAPAAVGRDSSTAIPAIELPKPLDIGNGLVAASFGRDGSWLSLGRPHSRHGFVELSGLPEFDERWRGDPVATRRYRDWMTDERFAFLHLDLPAEVIAARRVDVEDLDRPIWCRHGDGWRSSSTAWARNGVPRVIQKHTIHGPSAVNGHAALRFGGTLAVSPLPEITEVGPADIVHAPTGVAALGATLRLTAPRLGTSATVTVTADPPGHWEWRADADGGATLELRAGGVPRTTISVSVELSVGGSGMEPGGPA